MLRYALLSSNETQPEGNTRGYLRSYFQHADKSEGKLVCPQPLKVATGNVCKPSASLRPWRSMPVELCDGGEAGHEIMEIFSNKKNSVEAPCFGCSPPYFSGSPPTRAGNPVIKDKEFSRPRRPLSSLGSPQSKGAASGLSSQGSSSDRSIPSPAAQQAKGSATTTGSSFRPSPSVRIEGFECSGHGFRRVAAIA